MSLGSGDQDPIVYVRLYGSIRIGDTNGGLWKPWLSNYYDSVVLTRPPRELFIAS